MRNSLRWKLQAWYAVILAMVLLIFGVIFHALAMRHQQEAFDRELLRSMRLIGYIQLSPIARQMPMPLPLPPPPPSVEFENFDDSDLQWYIRSRAGEKFAASSSDLVLPDLEFPEQFGEPFFQTRDGYRQVAVATPIADIYVGRSLDDLDQRAGKLTVLLLLIGLLIWGLGLGGGYLLSSRTIRPIESMAATAESISAAEFSARIDLGGMDSEIKRLGLVLNHTFDRLEAEFEQQARFTADAAHELRTPLSVIRSKCDLALMKPREQTEYVKTIEGARDVCDRMNAIVNGLLLLAQIDADENALSMEAVDLYYLVEDCVQGVAEFAAAQGVEMSSELIHVIGSVDRNLLHQAIENLLTNAIRYNRSEGRVDIGMSLEDDLVSIQIKDTGVGISAEDQAHIFDRFYRVDTHRSREVGGAGLGLAICQGVIELHEGTITVASELGVGTTMTLALKVNKE